MFEHLEQNSSARGRLELAIALFGMAGMGLALAMPEARMIGALICAMTAIMTGTLYKRELFNFVFWVVRHRIHMDIAATKISLDLVLAALTLIIGIGVPIYVAIYQRDTDLTASVSPIIYLHLQKIDEHPSLILENNSNRIAENIVYGVAIFDLNFPEAIAPAPATRVPLPIVGGKVDFLRPHNSTAGHDIFLRVSQKIRRGDKIFGYLTADCPTCEFKSGIWVYYEWGNGGWYAPIKFFPSGAWFYDLLPKVAASPRDALSFIGERVIIE